jgi:hypothetical protein
MATQLEKASGSETAMEMVSEKAMALVKEMEPATATGLEAVGAPRRSAGEGCLH